MNSYDFEEKNQYRVRTWNEIEKLCPVPKALRTAIYLDTREALETLFLLDRGYRPENLLAVNREPVEVAMLTRKLKAMGRPTVRTAGVDWQRAVSESDGAHVVNFDGMGCYHAALVELLKETLTSLRPRVMAFNMLGGREQLLERTELRTHREWRESSPVDSLPKMTTFGKRANPGHAERIRQVLKCATDVEAGACLFHISSISWDVYVSESRQPMVWCVAGIKPHSASDKSWHRVERQWCLAPVCQWLNDPTSYRSALVEYQKIHSVIGAAHGLPFWKAAVQTGIPLDDLELLQQRSDDLRRRINLMNKSNVGVAECIGAYRKRHGQSESEFHRL